MVDSLSSPSPQEQDPNFQIASNELFDRSQKFILQYANELLSSNQPITPDFSVKVSLVTNSLYNYETGQWKDVEEARKVANNVLDRIRHWTNADNIDGRQEDTTDIDESGNPVSVTLWTGEITDPENNSKLKIHGVEKHTLPGHPTDLLGTSLTLRFSRPKELEIIKTNDNIPLKRGGNRWTDFRRRILTRRRKF